MKGLRKRILALAMAISMLTPSLAGASNFNGFLQVTEPDNPLPRQEETQDEDKKEDLEETVEEKNEVKTEETKETAEEKEETKEDEKKEEIEENQADETLKTIFSDFDLAMDDRVQIIEGQGVYDTPVRISRTLLQKQKRVILASGESYPDALTATSLVEGQYPVFFVKENSLPTMVGNEILRLEAEEVYILGGPDTISSRVEEELKALKPSISIKRLAGPTRYETAVEVAKERPKDKAILVDGLNFPDALTAQGLAYIKDQALVLTEPKALPQATKSFLESVTSLDIGGGPNSVGPEVLEDLRLMGLNPDKTFQGPNRFATAAALAEEFVYMKGEPSTVILASGDTYQNALASSILSQRYQAPTLLLGSRGVDKSTYDFLTKYRESIDKIIFVGNSDNYSPELFSYLEACILDGRPDPGVFAPYEALKQGSKGENVRLFHQKLKEENYYRGKVDDVFDAESEIALRLFLYNNNLPMDSSLSEQAWTMIKNGQGRTIDRSAREKITIKLPYHSQIDGIYLGIVRPNFPFNGPTKQGLCHGI